MASPLQELIDQWYESGRQQGVGEPITSAARQLAERAARSTGAQERDLDDIAQHAVEKLSEQLEEQRIRLASCRQQVAGPPPA